MWLFVTFPFPEENTIGKMTKKILGRFAENMYKNDRRHRPFLMDPQDNMIEGIIRNRWRDPKNDVTVTCHEASKR